MRMLIRCYSVKRSLCDLPLYPVRVLPFLYCSGIWIVVYPPFFAIYLMVLRMLHCCGLAKKSRHLLISTFSIIFLIGSQTSTPR